MSIYALVMLGAVFLAWGIILIIRGYRSPALEKERVVPISDIKEIAELRKAETGASLSMTKNDSVDRTPNPQSLCPLPVTAHILTENLAGSPSAAEKTIPPHSKAARDGDIGKYKNRAEVLEKEVILLKEKITQLTRAYEDRAEQARQETALITRALENEIAVKVKGALGERAPGKEPSDRLPVIQAALDTRAEENFRLKKEIAQQNEQIKQWREMTDAAQKEAAFRQERESLLVKNLEASSHDGQAKLDQAKAESDAAVKELQEIIRELNERLHRLEEDRVSGDDLSLRFDAASARIEELTREKENLSREMQALRGEMEKIREVNQYISQKENILQFELVKSRAQAVGLERICEDFKIQIEQMDRMGMAGSKG